MSLPVQVAIHASQFPERVRRALWDSLHAGRLDPRFLYDSRKQTQQWLDLHAALAPSRTDPGCAAAYDDAFVSAAARVDAPRVHAVGLGCGGGQKDSRLLRRLQAAGKEVFYTPVDVSPAMVLAARRTALKVIPAGRCSPLVCNLAAAPDLGAILDAIEAGRGLPGRRPSGTAAPPATARILTFFGMIPNFEPGLILPRLARLVRPADLLLLSANLAPGPRYGAGVKRVLPQYDNPPTRTWLLSFLRDLGVEIGDGRLRFTIEPGPDGSGLRRIVARFHFSRTRSIAVEGRRFTWREGESIRLFYSYRYTPARLRAWLARAGLRAREQWLAPSGEEGVFLARLPTRASRIPRSESSGALVPEESEMRTHPTHSHGQA